MVPPHYDALDLNETVKNVTVSRFDCFDRSRCDIIIVDTNILVKDMERTRIQGREAVGTKVCAPKKVLDELVEMEQLITEKEKSKGSNGINPYQIQQAIAYLHTVQEKGNILDVEEAKTESRLVLFEAQTILPLLGNAVTKKVSFDAIGEEFETIFTFATKLYHLACEKRIAFKTVLERVFTTRFRDEYDDLGRELKEMTSALEEKINRMKEERLLAAHYSLPGAIDYRAYITYSNKVKNLGVAGLRNTVERLCMKINQGVSFERAQRDYLERAQKMGTDREIVLAGYAIAPALHEGNRIMLATYDVDIFQLLALRQHSRITYEGVCQ